MDHVISLIGLNHRTADVDVRECCALPDCEPLQADLLRLGNGISEALILSTCNRVEILVVSEPRPDLAEAVIARWAAFCGQDAVDISPHCYIHQGLDAVRHVFTVASSIDSMVLGEPQILGQLKDAYRKAVARGSARLLINRIMHKAFSTAKRVRTETEISSSAVSVSYAAVELAKHIFGELSAHRALLIGAGEMAELAARHLLSAGVRELSVTNRTLSRAEELARGFSARAIPFDRLHEALAEADIVISSTGATQSIIRARDMKEVMKRRKNRPMFFIDIAVPRDIDPDVNTLDNVYLYDIDDLKEVVEENLAQRREEAEKAKTIVEEETAKFGQWLAGLDLNPTIKDLLAQAEELAERELKRSFKNLGQADSPHVRQVMRTLALSLSHKLYHPPIEFLKRRSLEEGSARQFIHLTRRIFNLDEEEIPIDAHENRKRQA